MKAVGRWLLAAAVAVSCVGFAPAPALAKPKVEWTRVDVPEVENAAKVAKLLKGALTKAAHKADFGKVKSVKLTAKLLTYKVEQKGDVLRVSCTAIGRVKGGASAKSKISFGGSPAKRAELEKQVLTMVANGLVARLAQIVRSHEGKK